MASISTDPKGNRIIQFKGADNKRHSVYLGKTPMKIAQGIQAKVQSVVNSQNAVQPLEPETARWLGSLDAKMLKKLVAVGLAEKRVDDVDPFKVDPLDTVHGFVEDFLQRQVKNVKESTATFLSHTVRNIKAKFPETLLLADLTEGDADDFRSYLKNDEKLAAATVARRCQLARSIFKDAKKRRRITANPFEDIKAGSTANEKRKFFVTRETVARVIDACPNAQRRLLVALSRYGGLRIPSEAFLLKWEDIDWERDRFVVHSPKTEHHPGKETRSVPIFPELRPYLEAVFEEPGEAEYVLSAIRHHKSDDGNWRNVNAGTWLQKLLRRAKIEPWPRIWHNMRASRQTELSDHFPDHVVSAWMGNSERIAEKHYKMVTDDHFKKAMQKAMQQPSASLRTGSQTNVPDSSEEPVFLESSEKTRGSQMGDTGFETSKCHGQKRDAVKTNVESNVITADPGLRTIAKHWGVLSDSERRRVIALVNHLAREAAGSER